MRLFGVSVIHRRCKSHMLLVKLSMTSSQGRFHRFQVSGLIVVLGAY
jgi:hypothetical protein